MYVSLSSKISVATFIILGASVLALAVPQVSSAEDATVEITRSTKTRNVDATCMQTAVDTREDALKTAWEGFNTDIVGALATRKTALHDAWGLTDLKAQRTAIAKAWKNWKSASKTAHGELRKDRKTAWDTFKKTTKGCGVAIPKDEALSKDASGTISL